MIRSNVWLSGSLALALVVGTTRAGTNVDIAGERVSGGLGSNYAITESKLTFREGRAFLHVEGRGDCRTVWRTYCRWVRDRWGYQRRICRDYPEEVCYHAEADYRLPTSVSLKGKEIVYTEDGTETVIGREKRFLFWKWYTLNPRAYIITTTGSAILRIEVDRPSDQERQETFARLHGEDPTMGLLVRFDTGSVSNERARSILREAGYQGMFAASNTWDGEDPVPGGIGVLTSRGEALGLLQRLGGDDRIRKIEPIGP